jgi:predicted TIM-barrel fold metal-dependent hydrolase
MSNPSRREFLGAVGRHVLASGVALDCAGTVARAVATWAPPAIDTHTHFYDPTRPEGVPWPGKDDKVLYRRVMPEHFRALAAPHGVTGTVVVEASPWVEDNQWLLDLAAREPFIVGVVGNLTPGDDEGKFPDHLARFAKNPIFRGIRIGHQLLKARLADERFVADVALLAERDLELDVNGGPEMPHDVARLAAKLPELRIVINHVANVRIDGKAPPADWLAGIQAAARHSRVFCKVSALVEGARPRDGKAPAELDFYRPTLDAVWSAFGADRLIYGSNWPVSERFADYSAVHRIVAEYFDAKGQAASEKFFLRNAHAAYKWLPRTTT